MITVIQRDTVTAITDITEIIAASHPLLRAHAPDAARRCLPFCGDGAGAEGLAVVAAAPAMYWQPVASRSVNRDG